MEQHGPQAVHVRREGGGGPGLDLQGGPQINNERGMGVVCGTVQCGTVRCDVCVCTYLEGKSARGNVFGDFEQSRAEPSFVNTHTPEAANSLRSNGACSGGWPMILGAEPEKRRQQRSPARHTGSSSSSSARRDRCGPSQRCRSEKKKFLEFSAFAHERPTPTQHPTVSGQTHPMVKRTCTASTSNGKSRRLYVKVAFVAYSEVREGEPGGLLHFASYLYKDDNDAHCQQNTLF